MSGKISPKMTYGIGMAPQEAMNIITEKAVTGTKWNAVKSRLVDVARKMNVAKIIWQTAAPADEIAIRSCSVVWEICIIRKEWNEI